MEDDVLRFDISVYNFKRMDFVDSLTDLSHDEGYPRLGERLRFF